MIYVYIGCFVAVFVLNTLLLYRKGNLVYSILCFVAEAVLMALVLLVEQKTTWIAYVLFLLAYAGFRYYQYQAVRRNDRNLVALKSSLEEKHAEEIETTYRNLRRWRHDYHNHLQKIKAHVALEQWQELKDYLNEVEADLATVSHTVQTGNSHLDAILNAKITIAVSKGVQVRCTATPPSEIPLSAKDLAVLLGNLLDNAIESSVRTEEPVIRLYIGTFREQFYLSVANPTIHQKHRAITEFISEKTGHHGFGMAMIRRIVKDADGYLNQRNEANIFVTEVMIPLR